MGSIYIALGWMIVVKAPPYSRAHTKRLIVIDNTTALNSEENYSAVDATIVVLQNKLQKQKRCRKTSRSANIDMLIKTRALLAVVCNEDSAGRRAEKKKICN